MAIIVDAAAEMVKAAQTEVIHWHCFRNMSLEYSEIARDAGTGGRARHVDALAPREPGGPNGNKGQSRPNSSTHTL